MNRFFLTKLFLTLFISSISALRDKSGTLLLVRGNKFHLEKRLYEKDDPQRPHRNCEVYRGCIESNCYAIKISDPQIGQRESNAYVALGKTTHTLKQLSSEMSVVDGMQKLVQVLELAEGTLSNFIPRIVRTDIIYSTWVQLLIGLYEMNRLGYMHNDLKPSNVAVLPGHVVKLMDFDGAIKLTKGASTKVQNRVVSPYYSMPPEKIRAISGEYLVGYQSDIWSLGMILYNLLFKKGAFDFVPEPNRQDCVYSPTCFIPTRDTNIDERLIPLRRMMEKCLARDLISRPTITELIEETTKAVERIGSNFIAAKEFIDLSRKVKGVQLY